MGGFFSAENRYRLGTGARQGIFSINLNYRAGTVTGEQQRILRGMLQAVGAYGYEKTTVQNALEFAGLYRQAFYNSFRDKEDCYLQALDAGAAWVESAMREEVTAATWRLRLRGALAGLLRFLDEQPEVGRALFVEVHAAGPAAIRKRTEAMARASALIDQAREESGRIAPDISAEAIVAGILAVLHGRLTASQTDDEFLRLLPELMYLAVLPYFGAETAKEELEHGNP
jgi:AcrR family transcriptional regulator